MPSSAVQFDPFTEFKAELEEIKKYKWVASEREGHDIGFERALTEWARNGRVAWRRERRRQVAAGA